MNNDNTILIPEGIGNVLKDDDAHGIKTRIYENVRRATHNKGQLIPVSFALTIASWWTVQCPTLLDLIQHRPARRSVIRNQIDEFLTDARWTRPDLGGDDDYHALAALRVFVTQGDLPV